MKIAILGYGVEGKAMAKYLLEHGEQDVTVCDQCVDAEIEDGLQARLGEDYLGGLSDFDVVFRSPGVKLSLPEVAAYRAIAEQSCYFKNGAEGGDNNSARTSAKKLTSMTRYFFEHCPCPIIGVTGTKGKGTTATLIYKMLKMAGRDVYLGGNIGETPVVFLDQLRSSSVVVLELSSFQLQDLDRSPHVAVVLNVTSEHMDYHVSVDEYVSTKQNIARHQREEDFLILNSDHPYARDFFGGSGGGVVGGGDVGGGKSGGDVGGGKSGGDVGGGKSGGDFLAQKIFISTCRKKHGDRGFIREDGIIIFNNHEILRIDDVGLIGEHNLENILPAIAVAEIMGVSVEQYVPVLQSFKGLPHRLEFVGEVNGVRFYNDSFSTIPETSIAGVLAFTKRVEPTVSEKRDGAPLYLIAGGSEKFSVYDEWAATMNVLSNVKKIFLMGPSGERMYESLKNSSVAEKVVNLRNAFEKAVENAREDISRGARQAIILLSPGAASFNEFQNYKERGEVFRELVKLLQLH